MASPTLWDRMTTITSDELAEWRRATLAATAGEWRQGNVEKYHVFCDAPDRDLLAPELGRVLLKMNTYFPYESDAHFIAIARTAMPRLIRSHAAANQVVFAIMTGGERDLVQRLEAAEALADRLAVAEVELDTYRKKGLGPFGKRAADILADEVNALVRRKVIDARSPAADALLDYRDPPYTERSDRMADVERENEQLHAQLVKAAATTMRMKPVFDAALAWRQTPMLDAEVSDGGSTVAWVHALRDLEKACDLVISEETKDKVSHARD